jgi:CheY-like chemotaxis protein
MSGNEAIRSIRAAETGKRHTRIVSLSAAAGRKAREIALAAGADDYLSKPITMAHLGAVLPSRERHGCDRSSKQAPDRDDDLTADCLPLFDEVLVSELKSIPFGNGGNLFTELARRFVAETPTAIAALNTADTGAAISQLRQHAHRLQGASAQIGARRMASTCRELAAIDDASDLAAIQERIARLKAEFATACRKLSSLAGAV